MRKVENKKKSEDRHDEICADKIHNNSENGTLFGWSEHENVSC